MVNKVVFFQSKLQDIANMSNSVTQNFVQGLKSRNPETRSKAARELYHYVSSLLGIYFIYYFKINKFYTATTVNLNNSSNKNGICIFEVMRTCRPIMLQSCYKYRRIN